MKSVLYLVKNNIRFKTGAFRSVIILMAIIVFSYSCSVSNSKNLNRSLNQSLDHYNVGDLVMTFKGSEIPARVTDGLDENENVSSYRTDDMLFVAMDCYADGKAQDMETRLVKQKSELKVFKDDLDSFYDQPPKLDEGEVYISFCFYKLYGLDKGKKLEIQTSPTTRETFTIKGFIEDPVYGTSLVAYENFFINENDWERIAKGVQQGTVNANYIYPTKMLHIFKSTDIKDFKLVKQLNDQCGLVDESMLYVTKSELVSYTEIYADVGTSLLYAFVGLLAVVVGLMMLNSINSTVEMQYVDLGILKSQGFTVWQIRLSYIIQYVFALFCGTVIGLLVSVPVLSVMGKLFMTVTGIWTDCSIDFLSNFIIALVIIGVFVMTLRKRSDEKKADAAYLGLVIATLVVCVCGLVLEFIEGPVNPGPVLLAMTIETILDMSINLMLLSWLLYAFFVMYDSIDYLKRRLALYMVPIAILMVLEIVNLFNGMLWYYDENVVYHDTDMYSICDVIRYAYLFISVFQYRNYRKVNGRMQFFTIWPYLLSMLWGTLIELTTEISGFTLGAAIGVTMVFIMGIRFLSLISSYFSLSFSGLIS